MFGEACRACERDRYAGATNDVGRGKREASQQEAVRHLLNTFSIGDFAAFRCARCDLRPLSVCCF